MIYLSVQSEVNCAVDQVDVCHAGRRTSPNRTRIWTFCDWHNFSFSPVAINFDILDPLMTLNSV